MKKIRAAVVGYGNIGKFTIEALQAAEDFEIAGIVKTTGKSEKPQAKPNVQRETLWETAVFTRRPAPPRHG